MTTSNSTQGSSNSKADSGKEESFARRAAEQMHEQIDKAAEKGEKFERTLYEQSGQAKVKARDVSRRMDVMARENPWLAIGGSVALGVVIGALMSRR